MTAVRSAATDGRTTLIETTDVDKEWKNKISQFSSIEGYLRDYLNDLRHLYATRTDELYKRQQFQLSAKSIKTRTQHLQINYPVLKKLIDETQDLEIDAQIVVQAKALLKQEIAKTEFLNIFQLYSRELTAQQNKLFLEKESKPSLLAPEFKQRADEIIAKKRAIKSRVLTSAGIDFILTELIRRNVKVDSQIIENALDFQESLDEMAEGLEAGAEIEIEMSPEGEKQISVLLQIYLDDLEAQLRELHSETDIELFSRIDEQLNNTKKWLKIIDYTVNKLSTQLEIHVDDCSYHNKHKRNFEFEKEELSKVEEAIEFFKNRLDEQSKMSSNFSEVNAWLTSLVLIFFKKRIQDNLHDCDGLESINKIRKQIYKEESVYGDVVNFLVQLWKWMSALKKSMPSDRKIKINNCVDSLLRLVTCNEDAVTKQMDRMSSIQEDEEYKLIEKMISLLNENSHLPEKSGRTQFWSSRFTFNKKEEIKHYADLKEKLQHRMKEIDPGKEKEKLSTLVKELNDIYVALLKKQEDKVLDSERKKIKATTMLLDKQIKAFPHDFDLKSAKYEMTALIFLGFERGIAENIKNSLGPDGYNKFKKVIKGVAVLLYAEREMYHNVIISLIGFTDIILKLGSGPDSDRKANIQKTVGALLNVVSGIDDKEIDDELIKKKIELIKKVDEPFKEYSLAQEIKKVLGEVVLAVTQEQISKKYQRKLGAMRVSEEFILCTTLISSVIKNQIKPANELSMEAAEIESKMPSPPSVTRVSDDASKMSMSVSTASKATMSPSVSGRYSLASNASVDLTNSLRRSGISAVKQPDDRDDAMPQPIMNADRAGSHLSKRALRQLTK